VADFQVVLDQGALHRLLESPSGDVGKELTRRTLKVHRAAVNLCAVDTGRLRASITWRLGNDSRGLVGIVGTSVEYAPYLEFGTRYMAAQPFLRPALVAA
jgi:HK97 gp10 family phage protein